MTYSRKWPLVIIKLNRWFGLDTLLAVTAIQLYVAPFGHPLRWATIWGLLASVSFIYMIDRSRDAMVEPMPSARHALYNRHPKWLLISLIGLGLTSAIYWWHLPTTQQWILLGCLVTAITHIYCLKYTWYRSIKDGIVAFIFTMVMMPATSMNWLLFLWVFLFTLFNLVIHRLIEYHPANIHWIKISIFGVVLLWLIANMSPMNEIWVVWGASILGHMGLLWMHKITPYWHELGELLFAFPFFIGYFNNTCLQ